MPRSRSPCSAIRTDWTCRLRLQRGDGLGGLACASAASRPGPLVGDRDVWLDGGHNPSASRQIAIFAKHQFADGKPLHIVFASLSTKDPVGMLEPFRGIASHVHTVSIPDHSCFSPDDLAEVAANLGFIAEPHDSVEAALSATPLGARALIFGSLYLAGAVLAANDQVPA